MTDDAVWCRGGHGETSKAFARRLREGWFDRYVRPGLSGIDIGCGTDPLCHTFRRYDKADGDAQTMAGVPSGVFHTVYASHILEHLHDPGVALESWFRLLAPGGLLIVSVPHRDLYERRLTLPSRWNDEHKTFWLPGLRHEPPCTRGLLLTCHEALPLAEVVDLRVITEGFHDPGPDRHAHGEFSIEMVVRRDGGG